MNRMDWGMSVKGLGEEWYALVAPSWGRTWVGKTTSQHRTHPSLRPREHHCHNLFGASLNYEGEPRPRR